MSILDIKKQSKIYIAITLFCILFAMIYEFFSHGVYSNFMIFAFLIPFVLGIIVPYLFYLFHVKKLPNVIEYNMYNAGIATITISSIIKGVLEIYGTTNSKIYVYLIVGIILLLVSIFSYIKRKV